MKTAEYNIFPVRVGYSNSVLLVNGTNSILVDTGVKGNIRSFQKLFQQFELKPADIKLIILTHIHYDHTGNLHKLAKLTGAKILVHKNEFESLKNGFIPIPTGQGKYSAYISKIGKAVYPKFASPKPFLADLTNEDEFDLHAFGIEGKIISTPGHTAGSQSVLLRDTLISGDTFINIRNGRIFPPFANDPKTLLETWQKLYDLGIREIYPGHGPKLMVEDTFPTFKKWTERFMNWQIT